MHRWLLILSVAALGLIAACTAVHRVAVPGPGAPASAGEIVGITTSAGVEVNFDRPATVQGDQVMAQVKNAPYKIASADVQRYWVRMRTRDTARTIGLVAGIAVGVAAVAY